MIVERTANNTKCDSSDCVNKCEYAIVNRRFIFDGSIYLCQRCLNALYSEIGRFILPKNIKPIYKKERKHGEK